MTKEEFKEFDFNGSTNVEIVVGSVSAIQLVVGVDYLGYRLRLVSNTFLGNIAVWFDLKDLQLSNGQIKVKE